MTVNHVYQISLLNPDNDAVYNSISETTLHDLGIDALCKVITEDAKEEQMIMRVMGKMTSSPETATYRQDVFDDILNLPQVREKLLDLMNQIDYLKDYGTWRRNADEKPGIWDLMHRLEELDSYIKCIEAMRECLSDSRIKSQGLKDLHKYVDDLYNDNHYAELKTDISELMVDASGIQSMTIGININSRFEVESLGLVSVNAKPFKKSGVIGNFADAIAASKDRINKDAEWDGDMHYYPADPPEQENAIDRLDKQVTTMAKYTNPLVGHSESLAKVPDGDGSSNTSFYLSNVATKLTAHIVKKLKGTLSKYTEVSMVTLSRLIPELLYYIRFAEFIKSTRDKGCFFCKPVVAAQGSPVTMNAECLYNISLATTVDDPKTIVDNDLVFDGKHRVFMLTGANRGGKTTITQAVGLLFALAQGGLYVPCRSFEFTPVDAIFTHYPADEDKTTDLGRLGEECVRFKDIFEDATEESLILLNESFSTTSFEEGYYIAQDAVKAIWHKNVRTIYNTHMHKLAAELTGYDNKVSSIVMESEGSNRSFKVSEMAPEGSSHASDIARKYGVTYDMLLEGTREE